MTSPIDPSVDPTQPPVASPAPGAAGMDDEIRQLARALNVQVPDALSARKAVVTAVDLGGANTAPSVTVDLSGVSVASVRLAASYTPVVGDTVLLLKQGNEFFAAFKIAAAGSKSDASEGGWITASLNASHAVQGSATPMYRRVNDHGSWKMQWKGAVNYGGATALLSSALPAEYRPSVARQMSIARSVTGGATTCRIDANTDGTLTVWPNATINLGSSASGGVSNHNHGGETGYTDPTDGLANNHAHSISMSDLTHTHGLGTASSTDPPWIGLDGLEYFL